jgi:hypothetical protein
VHSHGARAGAVGRARRHGHRATRPRGIASQQRYIAAARTRRACAAGQ